MKRFLLFFLTICLLAGCAGPFSAEQDTTASVSTDSDTQETTSAPPSESDEPIPEDTVLIQQDSLEYLLSTMTLEEKVGQMFLARCPESNALEDLSTYHLGGYLLFGRDFENQTPDSFRQTVASYQDRASIPLLLAVDEEGGTVCRVSSNSAFRSSRFPSPRTLYDQGGLDAVVEVESEKCQLLTSLGINVNMAPVCDITYDTQAFMYSRSLGQSPETTGEFVRQVTEVMAQNRLGNVLKHFPGYGDNTDTHTGIARDSRSLESLQQDLIPFRVGISSGCDAILVSHTVVEALDDKMPASLSPSVHQYLREEMGFTGVIVTDDLVMQAITDQYGAGEAAILAVLAGNDLLCSTDYQIDYPAVLEAVQDGRISEDLLDQAVLRILHWKQALGLIQ